jgi:hypothetical protein
MLTAIVALLLIIAILAVFLYGIALSIRNTLSEILDAVRYGPGVGRTHPPAGEAGSPDNPTYLTTQGINWGGATDPVRYCNGAGSGCTYYAGHLGACSEPGPEEPEPTHRLDRIGDRRRPLRGRLAWAPRQSS